VGLFLLTNSAFAEINEFVSKANLKEIWFDDDEYGESAGVEAQLQNESFTRGSDIDSLIRAKYKLISGDLRIARFYLNRISNSKSKLYFVKERYLAIIDFIEGNFNQSINHLSDKNYFNDSSYPQVCLLKLINYMAIKDRKSLKNESENCLQYSMKTSKNEAYWLDTMIKLNLNDQNGIKKNLFYDSVNLVSDDEMTRLWLKSGLYLNQEKEFLNLISILPESSYQSKRLREIVAFMYLRSKNPANIQKALAFIDDIDSANAENIKGSINLQKKEYELAFGHFKLALQKKQDSTNSIERSIPLAWLLNQWSDGISMLNNNINKDLDSRNKRAVKIAFLIRDKKFIEAEREITLLKIDFQHKPPLEVSIMDSYISLIMGEKDNHFDKRKIEEANDFGCKSFDGFSCWLALQSLQWENLGKTIKREDDVFIDKEMTLDSLKLKKEINPLKESVNIDQKDIEELDGSGIQLLRNNK
jgi:hypothetical protein